MYLQSPLALATVEIQQYTKHQLASSVLSEHEKRAFEADERVHSDMQTRKPTAAPTKNVTKTPTVAPTPPLDSGAPTHVPTQDTTQPTPQTPQPTTDHPTTDQPTTEHPSDAPTAHVTPEPTRAPTRRVTEPTFAPTEAPTNAISPMSPSSIVILVFVLLLFLALVIGGLIWLRRKKNPWIMNFLNPSKHHAYEEISGDVC
jgi:cobalamin biosynthesis Mg chelatase CobN